MKVLIQRVKSAAVQVQGKNIAAINNGLLAFIGIEKHDSEEIADKLLHKLLHYRVFSDAEGKMNLSVQEIEGGLLLVSQFTLAADTKKGLRPSFSSAALPQQAKNIYDYFVAQAKQKHHCVESGIFAADMQVSLINDGPVTFLLEE
jgi:D-tyrosyl-tRNA(Tyr) deacylase